MVSSPHQLPPCFFFFFNINGYPDINTLWYQDWATPKIQPTGSLRLKQRQEMHAKSTERNHPSRDLTGFGVRLKTFQLNQESICRKQNQPDALTTKAHSPTGTGTDLTIYFHTMPCTTNREQKMLVFASLGLISADGPELTDSASLTHFMVQRDGYMCQ